MQHNAQITIPAKCKRWLQETLEACKINVDARNIIFIK